MADLFRLLGVPGTYNWAYDPTYTWVKPHKANQGDDKKLEVVTKSYAPTSR